jgi:hypothetical protein
MKYFILFVFYMCSQSIFAQSDDELRRVNFPESRLRVKETPKKDKVWVFIMAGQSNMAGRGFVEPNDTLINKRILSINAEGELIYAKEPLHWYEPNLTGLDCGMSFAQTLLNKIPEDISILMLPVAIGGSSTSQWLGDSTYRNVPLFTNFKEKAALADFYGEVKGIIWHQGESDANDKDLPGYPSRIDKLFKNFRYVLGDDKLPIIMGELGSYSKTNENWQMINKAIHAYAEKEKNTSVINTQDLNHKGDFVHFNSDGQREMGRRFAEAYLSL